MTEMGKAQDSRKHRRHNVRSEEPDYERSLRKYVEYYETLTHRSVRLIEKLADPQMRFKDPFNDVEGLSAVERVFFKMFEDVENPAFKVLDKSWGEDGRTAYIKWRFTYGAGKKKNAFRGMSEILFSPNDGLVISHKDYWDAAESIYEKIPLLGWILRLIKKKISISGKQELY